MRKHVRKVIGTNAVTKFKLLNCTRHGRRKGGLDPLDFKSGHFPVTLLAKKEVFSKALEGKMKFHHF